VTLVGVIETARDWRGSKREAVALAAFCALLDCAEVAERYLSIEDRYLPILFEGPGGTAAEQEADAQIREADAALRAALSRLTEVLR